MKTLTINLPDELSPEQEHDLKMELAGVLYTKGLMGTSEAAALVGISRRAFIETMGQYGISILANFSEADFEHDLATARHYLRHQLPDSAH